MKPSYLKTFETGKLEKTAQEAFTLLGSCVICPRKCKVDRLKDQKGFCKTGLKARVYSFMVHHGEEPPVSGENGSGTIFFAGCNMACVYCQNYEFSQESCPAREVDSRELANIMLELQNIRCHNINLVTPTHVLPQILKALLIAIPEGLNIPLVYNTSGYELAEMIALLEGIVDIYLPDMRYADNETAIKYSSAANYPGYNQKALKEMQRQVGVAQIDKSGIINKGLVIRHLVLPQDLSGTGKIMEFIARELPKETYISLMSQYMPCYKSGKFPELSRRINMKEYEQAG
ncbi:MAG: radical SAM protein [Candidatus Omnitrophica bacterium]|nr:radical SAM protein [Candidatus Omnitrophota bacterium]